MASSLRPLTGSIQPLAVLRSAVILLALLLAPAAEPAWAQGRAGAQDPSSPESLTQSLVGLAAQGGPLQNIVNAAAARQQRLLGLMETDPAAVLRVAIPRAVRAGLPAGVQPYVEEEVALDGEMEVLHEDYAQRSRYVHFLLTSTERLSLHFAGAAPQLLTGTRVRVRGVRLGGAIALDGSGGSVQVLSQIAPNTFGSQKTLLILVNFQDKTTQPYTPAQAQSVAYTTTSNFYKENSFQQTWLEGDVAGWFTIALSSTVCDTSTLATYAKQAATAAGYTLSNYKRLIYGFPNNACSWWGMGTVGGSPSQAWINGTFSLKVVGHEFGHNLGLYHSHALECGVEVDTGTCSLIEYGDTLDIMGNPTSGHLTAYQKERLGWLNYTGMPPVTTVGSEGLYAIDTYETAGTNPKALKILKGTDASTGKKTWYYVEYRQAVGFDGFLSGNLNVLNGVVVHMGTDSSANSSYLLDLTPATTSWNDPALVLGQSFTDSSAGITITPVSMNATSAAVQVSMAPQTCVPGNPSVALAPTQSQWASPGTSVSYTVSVTNTDTSVCPTSSFALAAGVPAGWTGALGASSLVLAPGSSGSTNLSVTSPTSAPDGFYPVADTATNTTAPGYKGSGSATYVLLSTFSVSVAPSQPTYKRNQSATLTASVTSGGSPVSGVSVVFTIIKPGGAVATGSGTTDGTGKAAYRLKIQRQDPVGIYGVSVKATLGSASGSATTSFQVQ